MYLVNFNNTGELTESAYFNLPKNVADLINTPNKVRISPDTNHKRDTLTRTCRNLKFLQTIICFREKLESFSHSWRFMVFSLYLHTKYNQALWLENDKKVVRSFDKKR